MSQKKSKFDLSHDRHGSSLEHGEAHQCDHKKWTRRSFLSSLGLATISSGMMLSGMPVQAFARSGMLNRLAQADNNRALVLIQLGGGNDGLNTIIPVENDIYFQKRPTIAIPKQQSILLDDETGMHPAMGGLEPLFGEGEMAVIHNVGYSDPNRSHARSTDIWATGSSSNQNLGTGWGGRFIVEDTPDIVTNPPEFPLGVRIGGTATLFQSEFGNLGVTFGGASQFEQFIEQGGFYNEDAVANDVAGRTLSFARKTTNASFRFLETIQNASDSGSNLAEYPNSGLARSLAVVARLMRGGLGTKIYLVSKGGFDTHNAQGGVEGGHANLLADIADSVAAFYNDLKQDSRSNDALTMTFSEFGRTLDENSSNGTDHGSSAPVMMFGPVNGGLYGTQATLTELDNSGDPVYSTDYRKIYNTILTDWFGLESSSSEDVLNGNFDKFNFVNQVATSNNRVADIPSNFKLNQNYPNPFNPSTVISFALASASPVRLQVYDVKGSLIRTLIDGRMTAGTHQFTFNATNLPSGVYFYRLRTPNGVQTKKMTLIK